MLRDRLANTSSRSPFPWFYPVFFVCMIAHRAARDIHRCRTKYGDAWLEYERRVPYLFIPVSSPPRQISVITILTPPTVRHLKTWLYMRPAALGTRFIEIWAWNLTSSVHIGLVRTQHLFQRTAEGERAYPL